MSSEIKIPKPIPSKTLHRFIHTKHKLLRVNDGIGKNSIIQSMSIRTKIPKPLRQEMYTGSQIHTADYCV
jgi:hypothetical protein